MTSYSLYFSSYWYSVFLPGCADAAKPVKLSEQNECNCFPEHAQSYTLLLQQKSDFIAQTGVFSLETLFEVLMSGGSRSGARLTAW